MSRIVNYNPDHRGIGFRPEPPRRREDEPPVERIPMDDEIDAMDANCKRGIHRIIRSRRCVWCGAEVEA